MSTARTLSYCNDLRELSRMAEELCDYCREHGVDPDTTLALTLCMNELFANTVKYGYGKGTVGKGGGDTAEAQPEKAQTGDAGVNRSADSGSCTAAANASGISGGNHLAQADACPSAAPEGSHKTVEILLECFADRLEARYSDNARAFNPFANASALLPDVDVPPEALPTSGFGLHLLRRMSTSRSYARKEGRNRVYLTFAWR